MKREERVGDKGKEGIRERENGRDRIQGRGRGRKRPIHSLSFGERKKLVSLFLAVGWNS